jgi:RNA recognition motif-containing protein
MSDHNSAGSTIYIGNMPYTTTKEALIELMGDRKVERVTIPTDRETDRPRGFAFVEFTNNQDAADAVRDLDGTEFGGRTLKVNISKPREGRRDGGGGRRDVGGRRERRDRDRY